LITLGEALEQQKFAFINTFFTHFLYIINDKNVKYFLWNILSQYNIIVLLNTSIKGCIIFLMIISFNNTL